MSLFDNFAVNTWQNDESILIFKSHGNSTPKLKQVYAIREADIIFNHIMWIETCPPFSQDLHSSDPEVSLPVH